MTAAPRTFAQQQRLQDARRVLEALGANPQQVQTLAPQIAAQAGPIGQLAGLAMQRCR